MMRRIQIRIRDFGVVSVLAMLGVAGFCQADTWRVELDGTGDFTVIQDAVDAAAPGDTILIGPGRFETIRPIPWWDGFSATVSIQKGGLVLQGAGADETFIGAESIDWYYRAVKAKSDPNLVYSFTLRDAAIVGGYDGIHYEGDGLLVERCEFTNSVFGVSVFSSANNAIHDCYFYDMEGGGIFSYLGCTGFYISECWFERMQKGVSMQSVTDGVVGDCTFSETGVGIQFEGSSGEISNCHVSGVPESYYGSGIVLTAESSVTMSQCALELESTNYYQALLVRNGSVLSGSGNTIRGGGETSIYVAGHGRCEIFHGNEIYKANRYSVIAQYSNSDMSGPLVALDMTDNYWGTVVADSISSWIDDAHDHPQDSQYWMEVIYHPFVGGPVGVQQKSLSEVKSLFR